MEKRGRGRPKGSKSAATLEREKVLAEVRQRIMRSAGRLINSQMNRAFGMQFLFRIEITEKDGKTVRSRPKMVTDPDEIARYLEGDTDDRAEMFFITTKEPDGFAIDSLLNRTFGRPGERTEEDGEPEQSEAGTDLHFNFAKGPRSQPRRRYEKPAEKPGGAPN